MGVGEWRKLTALKYRLTRKRILQQWTDFTSLLLETVKARMDNEDPPTSDNEVMNEQLEIYRSTTF